MRSSSGSDASPRRGAPSGARGSRVGESAQEADALAVDVTQAAQGGRCARCWSRVAADGSLTLDVHAQPGAQRTEIIGTHGDALKIRPAAPAVDGKANAELTRFLAEAFGVPQRNVALVRGEAGRRKTVRILSPVERPDRTWGLLGQA